MSRNQLLRRALCALVVFAFALVLPLEGSAANRAGGRTIILGFDGADARTVESMMDAGDLPNLARLRDSGSFAAMDSSVPCESPVSWASLNAGQNPAKTGVQGFVKRAHYSIGPKPALGLRELESRPLSELEAPALLSFLSSRSPGMVAAIVGGAVFLAFLVVFLLLLRIRAGISIFLALLLAAVGAWGGLSAAAYAPKEIELAGNPVKAGGFWEDAARAGKRCIVLDAAMSWDRPTIEGAEVLAGLGVPDIRGQNGDWFIYTTDPEENHRAPKGRETKTAGVVFRVDEDNGRIDSVVFGPANFWKTDRLGQKIDELKEAVRDPNKGYQELGRIRAEREELEKELKALREGRMSLPLSVERLEGGSVRVTIGNQSQELADGGWSDWYRLTFELNPLLKVHAVTRAKVVSLEPFELFLSVLEIDPSNAPFWQPISQPASFSKRLADDIGEPYQTVGWACMTMPYKDSEIDDETFLEDIQFTQEWREKLTFASLERDDWDLLMSVESTVDRVQHMMYQHYDPQNPMHDAERADQKVRYFGEEVALRDVIPATYKRIDDYVGRVMKEHLRPEDTLILCADHGFQSFRRQVNINNWLEANGYLALKPGVKSSQRSQLNFIDWQNTKAYSLGLGMIFLNLAGRERFGIVSPQEAPKVIEDLRRDLLATTDVDGTRAVDEVYTTAEVHSGPYLGEEADLMVGFAATYRVSWRTTLGGIRLSKDAETGAYRPGDIFEDNTQPWSGDHVSMASPTVRGIFFCNRQVEPPAEGFNLLDIAPTALSTLGVEIPPEYDRPPLILR